MNVMKRIFLSAAMSVPAVTMLPRTLFAQHFAKPIDYPVGPLPSALAAGDFNRDGNVDLVVTIENGVRLLLGNGKGEFQPSILASPSRPPLSRWEISMKTTSLT